MKTTGNRHIARLGQIKVWTKNLPAHLWRITCIPKFISLFLYWIAPVVPVFSFLSASILISGILFISPTLSAQIPPLRVTISIDHHVSCFGGSDGQATAIVTGGVLPYTYKWISGETTATATGLSAGIEWVEVTDAQGIRIKEIVLISQPNAIVASASGTSADCNQLTGTITVNASGGTGPFEYMLKDYTGWETSNIFYNLGPGMYDVVVRDAKKCVFNLEPIEIENIPGATIITYYPHPSSYGLSNGSVEIVAVGPTLPLLYSITGDGNDWQESSEFFGLIAGPYMVWVTDANGCKDSLAFEILNEVEGKVNIQAETDKYCVNVPVELSVNGSNFIRIQSFYIELEFDPAALSFNNIVNVHSSLAGGNFKVAPSPSGNILLIDFSIAESSVDIKENQKLFTINFDALKPGFSELEWLRFNCKIFESAGNQVPDLYVNGAANIDPAPDIYATDNNEYCEDDELTLEAGPEEEGTTFTWTNPTGYTHDSAAWELGALDMTHNGRYKVTAINEFFCWDEKNVDVAVNPNPQISLADTDTICFEPFFLDPGSGYQNYLWQDGTTNQILQASRPDMYWVEVTDFKGCRTTDSVSLIFCFTNILVPNAFTPRGDGLNDEFKPIIAPDWEPGRFFMQVFNRWGEKVFETNDYNKGWDGTYKGALAPPGLYRYVIIFDASSFVGHFISSPIHGNVMVVR